MTLNRIAAGSLVALLALTWVGSVHAQFGAAWRRVPAVAVIGAPADLRHGLVDDAVGFWNKTFEEIGSPFRIGPVDRRVQAVPEDALQSLSRSILRDPRGRMDMPPALADLPGDITVFLGESDFVSFTTRFTAEGKRIAGIRGPHLPVMNLPNVARNVIAHELGHAIGLGHNSDPTMLMCGRPAPCRPDAFRSDVARVFPLTDEEKRRLLEMYPPGWSLR